MTPLHSRPAALHGLGPNERVYAHGFSLRKRGLLRRFLGDLDIAFVRRAAHVPQGGTLLLWGSRTPPAGMKDGVAVVRVEDGFLRSVGLGADLVEPLSWVIDRRGIYYDATRSSDLEHLLQTEPFNPALLERARRLRERIVAAGLTKYNVGRETCGVARARDTRRILLVPGQVESDASIRHGAPGVRTNLGLLSAVRAANPDACLVYKPHPDVVAGLRPPSRDEASARHWCDIVLTDADMGALLMQVDEVHTLTSLAGFEALLRGRPVTCYGQPFYAGWGLTTDVLPIGRRVRRLTLDALVAGALIHYPTYVSRATGAFITPEQALDELLAWRGADAQRLAWHRRGWRALVRGSLLLRRNA
ncbi:beta-3-deoxy-D-manno-oct-2-ulosonic acid transferase [Ralstonia solanacearum]|uniref:capsular polysaccharide export protein, LipB/KpsS family n=1 Tax=Ralstonia solanacearum TaxID=305 RepID=UPI001E28C645|nr:beta-3-deoxy-D-manno-oct-2-ulosonic acid transferase [Ralstonia solanacearum]